MELSENRLANLTKNFSKTDPNHHKNGVQRHTAGMMNKEYLWNLKDLSNIKKNGLKVFSCFSCGGGSSMGYKLSGFEVIGNNELDPKINNMYIKNHHPKYSFNCDIREMLNKEIPKEIYDIDILDGSPPCSVFSIAGLREKAWNKEKKFKEGQKKQRLDDLFIHFLNFAQMIKPKVIIAENVKGLIQKNAKGYVNEILKKFDDIGYDTQMFLLNSAKMGVPQARQRVFFIARRKNLNFSKLSLNFNEKPIKYGEFKDSNFKPINKNTQLYEFWLQRKRGDKSVCNSVMRTTGVKKRFSETYLNDKKTPKTITSGGQFLRFDVPGTLSDKDFITIQTFPQDYNFCGQNAHYVCGMSVPPIMMKKIAREVYLQFFGGQNV